MPAPVRPGVWIAVLAVAALLMARGGAGAGPLHAQQPETRIGIDVDTAGNEAASLGAIDDCVEIAEGEEHAVDVYVQDVEDLQAWEAIFTFEPDVVEIVDVDTALFMASSEGSDVQNVSGELPDADGRYSLGAFDAADPLSPDSGSGVLARLTVRGTGAGVSLLQLPLPDLNSDGKPDQGPLLQHVDVRPIGDVNGDTFFDGPIANARIAVDASCGDEPGPSGRTDGDSGEGDGGIGAITIIAIVAGFAGAITVGGLASVAAWRRVR